MTVFAAKTAQQQKTVEIDGRGISGPYDIDLSDYLEGSERVEILVRDRDTDRIISKQAVRRGTDYLLDFFRNALIFNAPVAQTDADGNPVSIRVTFETEGNGRDRYWLYGGEVNYQVNERTSVGARIVHADADKLSAERERIRAAYLRTELNDETRLEIELAQAENGLGQTGNAARITLDHQGIATRLKIDATHTDRHFDPTGASTSPGQDVVTLDFSGQLGGNASIDVNARYLADQITDTKTAEAQVVYNRKINDRLSGYAGVKVDHDFKADDDATTLHTLLGATWKPEGSTLTFNAELEAPVMGVASGRLTFGAAYEFRPGWTSSAAAEFEIDSDGNIEKATRLQFGMDYNIAGGLSGRTEVTANGDGLGEAQLVQGIKGSWDVTDQLTVGFGVEHNEPISGDSERLTSLTLGTTWEAADGNWVIEADVDQTFEEDGRTLYTNVGAAGQITPSLTFLARSRLAIDSRGDGPEHLRHRARVGLAYRPTEDPRFDVLAWYEHQLERREQSNSTHMWSVAGAYEATDDLRLNAKYAGQLNKLRMGEDDAQVHAETLTQLAQAGMTYDFGNDRWEAGLNVMRIWDDQGSSTNAAGIELGYVLNEGSLLSVGYNKSMGRAPAQSPLYQEGLYLRMRIVLDSSLWDRLGQFGAD